MTAGKKRRGASPGKVAEGLIEGFRSWCEARGHRADVDTVDLLLHYRLNYLDPHLTRWTSEDLYQILLDLFPRNVVVEDEEMSEIVTGVRWFLDFLVDTGLLAPGSEPAARLHEALDEIEDEIEESVDESDVLETAARIGMLMEAEGVDVSDPAALQAWVDDLATRPFEELQGMISDLVTPLEEPRRFSIPEDFAIPAVRLLPAAELEAMAAAGLARLRTFVTWVGEGHPLAGSGTIPLPAARELASLLGNTDLEALQGRRPRSIRDLPDVEWTHAWADEAGFVDICEGRLVATELGRRIDDQPLDAWRAALDGLLRIGIVEWRRGRRVPPWAELLDGGLADLIGLAYMGEDLASEDLAEMAWEQMSAATEEVEPGVPSALLADVEMVSRTLAEAGVAEAREGKLALTALGMWGVNALLREDGWEAPFVVEVAEAEPAALLEWLGTLEPDQAEAEAQMWVAARTPEVAVRELADAARGDEGRRTMLMLAIDGLGDEAAPTVRELLADPALRPYALVWLVERGLEPEKALTVDDGTAMIVDQLAAILHAGGPDEMTRTFETIVPRHEQKKALRMLSDSRRAGADPVLAALAAHHPDPVVSRSAGKLRLQRGTPTGG